MPTISPTWLLVLTLLGTSLALGVGWLNGWLRRGRIGRLGQECGYTFIGDGDLLLARRLYPHLPAIGAADVKVMDLLTREDEGEQVTIARVDYLLGSVGHRRSHTRVVRFCQRRGSGLGASNPPLEEVRFAPASLPRIDQYRYFVNDAASGERQERQEETK